MAVPENKEYRPRFIGDQLVKHTLPTHQQQPIDLACQLPRYIVATAMVYRANRHDIPWQLPRIIDGRKKAQKQGRLPIKESTLDL